MTPEEWDGEIAEQLLRDAEAVAGELMQSLDEVADTFDSESFEASVTGDGARLLRLAEDARTSASAGRDIAQAYEVFAQGVERRSLPLCRVAAAHLRRLAEIEHMLATSPDPMDEGGFGMLD